ncbi:MAG: lipase class 2 [Thermoleophilia bacterium]|nr:lipase class 2 [Thermoleophilia bacterium]
MTGPITSGGVGPDDAMSPASRLYQWLVQAGSAVNRVVNPNPERLGTPLPPAQAIVGRGREPIVLVGGYASMVQSLEPLAASLRADGFEVYVFEVPANGLADIHHSAARLAAFVADVRRRSGAARVDVVAHSAGGIVARTWAQLQGGAASIDQLVTIATPHHGVVLLRSRLLNAVADSRLGHWLLGGSTSQLLHGSALMRELESTRGALGAARLTSVFVDGYDGLLAPLDTAIVQGATNIRLAHPGRSVSDAGLGHFTLHRRSDRVYDVVRGVLLGVVSPTSR